MRIRTTRLKMNSQVFADFMQFINFSWSVWGDVEEGSWYFHVFSLKNSHCYINKTEHLSRTYSYMTFQGFWRKCTERKWTPAATASKKTSKWTLGVENKEEGAGECVKKSGDVTEKGRTFCLEISSVSTDLKEWMILEVKLFWCAHLTGTRIRHWRNTALIPPCVSHSVLRSTLKRPKKPQLLYRITTKKMHLTNFAGMTLYLASSIFVWSSFPPF